MIDWQTVLTTLGSSTLLVAIVAYIGKNLFNQFLLRDLANYKSNHDKEVERLKSDLQISTLEHQIRYQNLHTARAEVIAELYSLLVQAEQAANSFVDEWQSNSQQVRAEKSKQAHESSIALYHYFERHKIYFKQASCEKISKFTRELYQSIVNLHNAFTGLDQKVDEIKHMKEWMRVWQKLRDELPRLKTDIEEEFREILGL